MLPALERVFRGLPGGPMVKNPPANAGDTDWIPGPGTRVPHATTTEARALESGLCHKRSHHDDKPEHHS